MNCWHCNTELIWGGDHDTEDNEEYDIVSNLSCPKCHSAVDVWHPSEKLIEEYKKHKKNKKRNPLVRQLKNWYQRIVKSKKIYNRKKKYENK